MFLKLSMLLYLLVVLAGCSSKAPSQKYDAFDNITEVKTTKCSLNPIFSELCVTFFMKYRGRTTIDQLKSMNLEQLDKLIVGRYVKWQYTGDDWLFVKKIVLNIDGVKHDAFGELSNREVRSDGRIEEWEKIVLDTNSEMHVFYKKWANGGFTDNTGKKIIRVYGENYYSDFIIK